MDKFNGFSKESIDLLWQIRFNNTKQWYYENKNNYDELINTPIKLLSSYILKSMKEVYKDFNANVKISRINRDIRFTKNKLPYKENKWFLIRESTKGSIKCNKPTYFFEMSPEWYRYGLSYCPETDGLLKYRSKADNDLNSFKKIIKKFNSQKTFILEGEKYKKLKRKDLDSFVSDWYNRKELIFVNYDDYNNKNFFESDLKNIVLENFKLIYFLYNYFYTIK